MAFQTYFSVFLFLIEQYSYLANYYYDRGQIDKYRACFGNLSSVFTGFKASLLGGDASDSLIGSIINILKIVKKKDFVGLDRSGLYEKLNKKIETFEKLRDDFKNLASPLITETPENYSGLSFTLNIKSNTGEWIKEKSVRYAVQYQRQNNSQFFEVKEWSPAITVQERACPTLTFPRDPKTVLIFRKFEMGPFNQNVQLVGTLRPTQMTFLDIDRDLYNAAENPDIRIGKKEAKIFLRNGADLSVVFEKGRSVLHAAAKSANVFLLIKSLFHVKFPGFNVFDDDGYAPIHIAAQAGNAGIVKLLLNFNAQVNAKTNHGLTALHIAAEKGFILTVQNLFESLKINLYEKDENGFTPLHSAVKGGKEIMEAFIKKGVDDIDIKSNNELTPFHLAIINNDLEVAEVLRRTNKVDVNLGDTFNMTPLHYAAMLGNASVVNYLRMLPGIKMNIVTKDNNWSPLHYAIFFKKTRQPSNY
uniref:Alpha-latrotoxin n=1 Tax=Latrodectus hasselti TaxID=256736 RepID=A0A482ZD87_LATHA